MKIGFTATGGEVDTLETDGIHAWSSNPQYVAGLAILTKWAALSASGCFISIAAVGFIAVGIAPLAEELWLEDNYGQQLRNCKAKVRRFL